MAIIFKPGNYRWKETPGGTGWSLLRHDPAGDTQTRLLRYSPTTVVPAARLDHTVQWLVTRGEARCGDWLLRRGGYFCWPQGHERPAVLPGEEGYTVLSVVYGAASGVEKPLQAIEDPDRLPWEATGTPADTASGLELRPLDPETAPGAGAALWRLLPGHSITLPTAPTLQEIYVLQGTLACEGERIPSASYLAFTPGDDRSMLEALDRPVVLFVNTHG
jgi:hypothetical protein